MREFVGCHDGTSASRVALYRRRAWLLLMLLVIPFFSLPASAAPFIAYSGRVAGDDHRARLIVSFDRQPDVEIHYVAAPPRILIDMPATAFALPKDALAPRGLFASIRYGAMGPGRARIVLQTKVPASVDLKQVVKNEDGTGARLVVDVAAISNDAYSQLLKTESWTGDQDTSADTKVAPKPKGGEHKFTVVVDPGHGGIDSGAIGIDGTLEKNVTLPFGRMLADDLRAEGVNVVMTRNDDEFISLGDRVKIGRENHADLFISIHANTVSVKGVRGATVYTLSDKASDRLSARIAESENQSDAVAGLSDTHDDDGVADILMDLTRRETQVFSDGLAKKIVSSFDGNVRLINNPHRYAGFRVLEAPDVPSVLVELGYLSNPDDEKLLNDPKWRGEVAGLLTKSILRYRATVLASRN